MSLIKDFLEAWLEMPWWECLIEIGGTAVLVILIWLMVIICTMMM